MTSIAASHGLQPGSRGFYFSAVSIHSRGSALHSHTSASEPAVSVGSRSHSARPFHVSDPSDATEIEADRAATRLFPSSAVSAQSLFDCSVPSIDEMGSGLQARHQATEKNGGGWTSCAAGGKVPAVWLTRAGRCRRRRAQKIEERLSRFLAVRIHQYRRGTGERSLKAQAFTYRNDIFFDEGRYNPHTLGKTPACMN